MSTQQDEGPRLVRIDEYNHGYGMGWLAEDQRKFYSAPAERNKQPILEILQLYLSNQTEGVVLEVASGSGQHMKHFAPAFPSLEFLPSEYPGFPSPKAKKPQKLDEVLGSISAYCEGIPNILQPIRLDVTSMTDWPTDKDFCGVLAINLLHISPQAVTDSFFAGAGKTVRQGGHVMVYGPFKFGAGPAVPESNEKFDQMLAQLDTEFGLRDVHELDKLAKPHGLVRVATHDMPANNHMLIYKKE